MMVCEGDWVKGTTEWDEFFIGFVDKIGSNETIRVYVTQCDNEERRNTPMEVQASRLKLLPDSAPSSAEEFSDLIELALMTHDKEWFFELHQKLASIPVHPAENGGMPERSLDVYRRQSFTAPMDLTDM